MTEMYDAPRTECPSCGGAIARQITGMRDPHYGVEGEWNWDACAHCGLWFVNPGPLETFLYAGDNYDDETYYAYGAFETSESLPKKLARIFLRYAPAATGDPSFAKPGRMIDIGCGSGATLYQWRAKGWQVHGLEPNATAARVGREQYGLDIVDSWEAAEKHADGSFDYIRLNHSFEHMLNPDEALAFIARKLAPDGTLFIGVPNVDSLPRRLFGKHWWNLGAPLHPFGWSARSIRPVLQRNGLEIETWRTNSNFSGLSGSWQIKSNVARGVYKDTGAILSNPVIKILANTAAKVSDIWRQGDCLEVIARKAAP